MKQSEQKQSFANTLSDLSGGGHLGNECERYGMTWGCDTDCPVLRRGQCSAVKDGNEDVLKIYLEFLEEEEINQ